MIGNETGSHNVHPYYTSYPPTHSIFWCVVFCSENIHYFLVKFLNNWIALNNHIDSQISGLTGVLLGIHEQYHFLSVGHPYVYPYPSTHQSPCIHKSIHTTIHPIPTINASVYPSKVNFSWCSIQLFIQINLVVVAAISDLNTLVNTFRTLRVQH